MISLIALKFGAFQQLVGSEVRVLCPFHDDRNNPNLDINTSTGAYICRACGAHGRIAKDDGIVVHKRGYGDQWSKTSIDEWPQAFSGKSIKPATEKKEKKSTKLSDMRLVARYPYVDADGTVLFYVERLETSSGKKTFLQKAADGSYSIKGIPNVPMFFDKIKKMESEDIFIVEGEKCAIYLTKRLGVLATTFAGGSGFMQNNRKIITSAFVDRTVIAIQDNDVPGVKWTKSIIELLSKKAKNLHIINPSMLKLKHGHNDIVDWFNGDGTDWMFYNTVELSKIRNYANGRNA